eukprot:g14990.t1
MTPARELSAGVRGASSESYGEDAGHCFNLYETARDHLVKDFLVRCNTGEDDRATEASATCLGKFSPEDGLRAALVLLARDWWVAPAGPGAEVPATSGDPAAGRPPPDHGPRRSPSHSEGEGPTRPPSDTDMNDHDTALDHIAFCNGARPQRGSSSGVAEAFGLAYDANDHCTGGPATAGQSARRDGCERPSTEILDADGAGEVDYSRHEQLPPTKEPLEAVLRRIADPEKINATFPPFPAFPTPRFLEVVDADTGERITRQIDARAHFHEKVQRLRAQRLRRRQQQAVRWEVALLLQRKLERKLRKWITHFEGLGFADQNKDPNAGWGRRHFDNYPQQAKLSSPQDDHATSGAPQTVADLRGALRSCLTGLEVVAGTESSGAFPPGSFFLRLLPAAETGGGQDELGRLLSGASGLGGSRFDKLSDEERTMYIAGGIASAGAISFAEVREVVQEARKIVYSKKSLFLDEAMDVAELAAAVPRRIALVVRLRQVRPVLFRSLTADVCEEGEGEALMSKKEEVQVCCATWPEAVRKSVRDASCAFVGPTSDGSGLSADLCAEAVVKKVRNAYELAEAALLRVTLTASPPTVEPCPAAEIGAAPPEEVALAARHRGLGIAETPSLLFWSEAETAYVCGRILEANTRRAIALSETETDDVRFLRLAGVRDVRNRNCLDFAVGSGLRHVARVLLEWRGSGFAVDEKHWDVVAGTGVATKSTESDIDVLGGELGGRRLMAAVLREAASGEAVQNKSIGDGERAAREFDKATGKWKPKHPASVVRTGIVDGWFPSFGGFPPEGGRYNVPVPQNPSVTVKRGSMVSASSVGRNGLLCAYFSGAQFAVQLSPDPRANSGQPRAPDCGKHSPFTLEQLQFIPNKPPKRSAYGFGRKLSPPETQHSSEKTWNLFARSIFAFLRLLVDPEDTSSHSEADALLVKYLNATESGHESPKPRSCRLFAAALRLRLRIWWNTRDEGLFEDTIAIIESMERLRVRPEGFDMFLSIGQPLCFVAMLDSAANVYFNKQARLEDNPAMWDIERRIRDECKRFMRDLSTQCAATGNEEQAVDQGPQDMMEMLILRSSFFREAKNRLAKRKDSSDETLHLLLKVRDISKRFFSKKEFADDEDFPSRVLPAHDLWTRWLLMNCYLFRGETEKIYALVKEINGARDPHIKRIFTAWHEARVKQRPLADADPHLLQAYSAGKPIPGRMSALLEEIVSGFRLGGQGRNAGKRCASLTPTEHLQELVGRLEKPDIGPSSAVHLALTILFFLNTHDPAIAGPGARPVDARTAPVPRDLQEHALRLVFDPPPTLKFLATHKHIDALSFQSQVLPYMLDALCKDGRRQCDVVLMQFASRAAEQKNPAGRYLEGMVNLRVGLYLFCHVHEVPSVDIKAQNRAKAQRLQFALQLITEPVCEEACPSCKLYQFIILLREKNFLRSAEKHFPDYGRLTRMPTSLSDLVSEPEVRLDLLRACDEVEHLPTAEGGDPLESRSQFVLHIRHLLEIGRVQELRNNEEHAFGGRAADQNENGTDIFSELPPDVLKTLFKTGECLDLYYKQKSTRDAENKARRIREAQAEQLEQQEAGQEAASLMRWSHPSLPNTCITERDAVSLGSRNKYSRGKWYAVLGSDFCEQSPYKAALEKGFASKLKGSCGVKVLDRLIELKVLGGKSTKVKAKCASSAGGGGGSANSDRRLYTRQVFVNEEDCHLVDFSQTTGSETPTRLGRGRLCQVYAGSFNGTPVALKVVAKKNLKRSEAAKLQTEIVVHSQLQHPHVLDIFHAFEDADYVVLVLERAEGIGIGGADTENNKGTSTSAPFTEARLRKFLSEILKGLAYLHGLRYRHGGICVENLLLDAAGRAKLADFSDVARFQDPRDRDLNDWGDCDLNHNPAAAGSPADDLYALGSCAAQLLLRPALPSSPTGRMATASPIRCSRTAFPATVSKRCVSCLEMMQRPNATAEMLLGHAFFLSALSIPRIVYDPRNEEPARVVDDPAGGKKASSAPGGPGGVRRRRPAESGLGGGERDALHHQTPQREAQNLLGVGNSCSSDYDSAQEQQPTQPMIGNCSNFRANGSDYGGLKRRANGKYQLGEVKPRILRSMQGYNPQNYTEVGRGKQVLPGGHGEDRGQGRRGEGKGRIEDDADENTEHLLLEDVLNESRSSADRRVGCGEGFGGQLLREIRGGGQGTRNRIRSAWGHDHLPSGKTAAARSPTLAPSAHRLDREQSQHLHDFSDLHLGATSGLQLGSCASSSGRHAPYGDRCAAVDSMVNQHCGNNEDSNQESEDAAESGEAGFGRFSGLMQQMNRASTGTEANARLVSYGFPSQNEFVGLGAMLAAEPAAAEDRRLQEDAALRGGAASDGVGGAVADLPGETSEEEQPAALGEVSPVTNRHEDLLGLHESGFLLTSMHEQGGDVSLAHYLPGRSHAGSFKLRGAIDRHVRGSSRTTPKLQSVNFSTANSHPGAGEGSSASNSAVDVLADLPSPARNHKSQGRHKFFAPKASRHLLPDTNPTDECARELECKGNLEEKEKASRKLFGVSEKTPEQRYQHHHHAPQVPAQAASFPEPSLILVDTKRVRKPVEMAIAEGRSFQITESGEVRIIVVSGDKNSVPRSGEKNSGSAVVEKTETVFAIEPGGVHCRLESRRLGLTHSRPRRYEAPKYLPGGLKQYYGFAFEVVNRLRAQTPKVVLMHPDYKCELMDNVPMPDFLLTFHGSFSATASSSSGASSSSSPVRHCRVVAGRGVLSLHTGDFQTEFELPLDLVLGSGSCADGGEKGYDLSTDMDRLDELLVPFSWELGDVKPVLKIVSTTFRRALLEERKATDAIREKLRQLHEEFANNPTSDGGMQVEGLGNGDACAFDAAFEKYQAAASNAWPVVLKIG